MAVDSENKRRSVSNWFCRIPPVPDGTITGVDKQHVGGFYSGIPATTQPFLLVTLSQEQELSIALSQEQELSIALSQEQELSIALSQVT